MAKQRHNIGKASVLRTDYDDVLHHFGLERPGGKGYVSAHQRLLLYRPKQGRVQFVNYSQASQIVQMRMSGGKYSSTLTGQFLRASEVQALLAQLEGSATPAGWWGREGKYRPKKGATPGKQITFQVLGDLDGMLPRMSVLIEQSSLVGMFLKGEANQIITAHVPEIQNVIRQRMQTNVYKTHVTLIRYMESGKPRESHPYNPGAYPRTYNLIRAFTEGITVSDGGLQVGINENFAPYWLWIEKGHRVFTKYGETGTFVVGRPFYDQIRRDVQEYIEAKVVPDLNNLMSSAANKLSEWVMKGGRLDLLPKNVKNVPGRSTGDFAKYGNGGYGDSFERRVGLK